MIECPIHKVAKNDIISENECRSCDFYNDCLFDMTSDMEDEMLYIAKKYLVEMRETIKGHAVKKVKDSVREIK